MMKKHKNNSERWKDKQNNQKLMVFDENKEKCENDERNQNKA